MKNAITSTLLLCLFYLGCNRSNITYDAEIEQRYKKIVNTFPDIFHNKDLLIADTSGSKRDTMNIRELKKMDTNVSVQVLAPKNSVDNSSAKQDPMNRYDVWFSNSKISYDTLVVSFGVPFSAESIKHQIFSNNVTTTFAEIDKYEALRTIDPKKPLQKTLIIPAKTLKFQLSSPTYKTDSVIYGKAEFITDPYYVKDENFKSGFLKKRVHMTYLFKVSHQ